MAVAARASSATGPASEAASELGWLCLGSVRRGTCGAPPRGRPGPPGGATGKSPTSGGSSRRRRRRLLSLCYGARGIPGRVTCRGRLRLEGVGLEQRHRVDRDGRDDRDDGVDDEALSRVGVVRGAAHFGAASFAIIRREARPAVLALCYAFSRRGKLSPGWGATRGITKTRLALDTWVLTAKRDSMAWRRNWLMRA